MLARLRSLLELIRFSHTLFALPFALTSAALAWKRVGFSGPNFGPRLGFEQFGRGHARSRG